MKQPSRKWTLIACILIYGVVAKLLAAESEVPTISYAKELLSTNAPKRQKAMELIIDERKVMISELIKVITNVENQVRNPDAVKKAMLSLGEIRAEESIKVLVLYIGFPAVRQSGVKQELLSFQNKPSPVIEDRLPAVAALLKIGESCIDEVVRKLAVTDDATELIACVRVLQVFSAHASVNAKLQNALKRGSKVEKNRIKRALELIRQRASGTQ